MRCSFVSLFGSERPNTFQRRRNTGFTLVELLVTISIIGILVSLVLMAVVSVRASARRTQCSNQLRQLGMAAIQYHDVRSQFPSAGWGFGWVGDPNFVGYKQPGSWCYSILPFLEQSALGEMGWRSSGEEKVKLLTKVNETPVPSFYCPSRRVALQFPINSKRFANTEDIKAVGKTDYAANGGDVGLGGGWGPDSYDDARSFKWDDFRQANGICHQRSRVRIRHVKDGVSKTFLLGEKYVSSENYITGKDLGDDQSAFTGYDSDTVRWTPTELTPINDSESMDQYRFGGPHKGVCLFAFCDGSVQQISVAVDPEVFRAFGNRKDQRVVATK